MTLSFYDQLAKLPPEQQDEWEEYLLHWYPIDRAAFLLDYVVHSDCWAPKIIKLAKEACAELSVVRLPELVERVQEVQFDADLPFLQAVVQVWDKDQELSYNYDIDIDSCSLHLRSSAENWLTGMTFLLKREKVVTFDLAAASLNLTPLLRHYQCFGVFERLLREEGIWSFSTAWNYISMIRDSTEMDLKIYYGTWGMDHYRATYKDPSIDLNEKCDVFYFNQEYLNSFFQTIAGALGKTKGKTATYKGCARLWAKENNITYKKSKKYLEDFCQELCTMSAWGVGDAEINGEEAMDKANVEKLAGGRLRLVPSRGL